MFNWFKKDNKRHFVYNGLNKRTCDKKIEKIINLTQLIQEITCKKCLKIYNNQVAIHTKICDNWSPESKISDILKLVNCVTCLQEKSKTDWKYWRRLKMVQIKNYFKSL